MLKSKRHETKMETQVGACWSGPLGEAWHPHFCSLPQKVWWEATTECQVKGRWGSVALLINLVLWKKVWPGGSRGEPDTTLTSCLHKPSDTGSLVPGVHFLGGKCLNIAYTQTCLHSITHSETTPPKNRTPNAHHTSKLQHKHCNASKHPHTTTATQAKHPTQYRHTTQHKHITTQTLTYVPTHITNTFTDKYKHTNIPPHKHTHIIQYTHPYWHLPTNTQTTYIFAHKYRHTNTPLQKVTQTHSQ